MIFEEMMNMNEPKIDGHPEIVKNELALIIKWTIEYFKTECSMGEEEARAAVREGINAGLRTEEEIDVLAEQTAAETHGMVMDIIHGKATG